MEVVDRTEETSKGGPARKAAREKADSAVLGSVGAPMAGEVIEVTAKPGLLPPSLVAQSVQQATRVNQSSMAECPIYMYAA